MDYKAVLEEQIKILTERQSSKQLTPSEACSIANQICLLVNEIGSLPIEPSPLNKKMAALEVQAQERPGVKLFGETNYIAEIMSLKLKIADREAILIFFALLQIAVVAIGIYYTYFN